LSSSTFDIQLGINGVTGWLALPDADRIVGDFVYAER
jgi:hypothetical protein